MNKKLSLLLVMLLAVSIVFTGCSPEAISYMEESQRVAEWEAVEGSGNMEMTIEVSNPEDPEEKMSFSMPMELEIYTVGQTTGEMTLTYDFTNLKALAPEEEKDEIPDKIEFPFYIDTDKVIFSKDLFRQFGEEDAPILEGEEEYVGLLLDDALMGAADLKEYQNLTMKLQDEFMDVFEDYESTIDIVKNGNVYSYEAGADELLEEIKSLVKYIQENNEEVISLFEPLILQAADEDDEVVKAELEEMKEELKKIDVSELDELPIEELKDSKIKVSTEFSEDSYKQDLEFVMNLDGFMKITMKMDSVMNKAEVRDLNIPTDVKVIDLEDYFESMINIEVVEDGERPVFVFLDDEIVEFDSMPIIEEGRTLVPCRKIFEEFEADVKWDDDERVVTINKGDEEIVLTIDSDIALVNGEEVKLDKAPRVEEDRTLVPLRFLAENLGLDVEFEMDEFGFYVSLYSKDYEVEEIEEEIEEELEEETEKEELKEEIVEEVEEELSEEVEEKVEDKVEEKLEEGSEE